MADESVIVPSGSCVVVVWPGRLELAALPGVAVGRTELEVLAGLATGRYRSAAALALALHGDADHAACLDLVRRLRYRGLVVAAPPPDPVEASPAIAPATPPVAGSWRLEAPLSVRPVADGFELLGHDGHRVARFTVDEVLVLPALASTADLERARSLLDPAVEWSRPRLEALLARLHAAGFTLAEDVAAASPRAPHHEVVARVREAFAVAAEADDRREADREARTGVRRTAVVPVSFTNGPPLALGLIVAHCLDHDGGRLAERYHFRTDWEWDDRRLGVVTRRPAVYLGSAYVWSHVRVLEVLRAVKEREPRSLTVVGGPDAPKREGDAATYLAAHPEVDVVVRGEGEQTARELLDAVEVRPDGSFDLAALGSVAGLTVRVGDGLVRTPDRDRMADLNAVPSPFLTGLFDTYRRAPLPQVILETNRGCPYGCTFCDWGSATQSRIRQFDLDRVLAEIDWAADAGVEVISLADANFGIFPRDADIARHVASVRTRTGHPHGFGANFAKNTVKHLGPIIRTLLGAGIVNRGLLALQTTDQDTLATIERSNIKVERYEAIATEMRAAGLPFAVELMMGLPGATVDSFTADLQQCIDREVEGTVNPTSVLVNSPMNAPEYRTRHRIETAQDMGPGRASLVVATATFTREEYQEMRAIRRTFLLAENFGATRYVDRVVRHQAGVREIDFLRRLHHDVVVESAGRLAHPYLWAMFDLASPTLIVPVSWRLFVDDLVAYVRRTHPEVDPAALATAARVQHALLPAFDRAYPVEITLDHDYVAWFSEVVAAKEAGHGADWPDHVAPLTTHGPGSLRVDDPGRSARRNLGCSVDHGPLLATWEHHSAVSRVLYAPVPV